MNVIKVAKKNIFYTHKIFTSYVTNLMVLFFGFLLARFKTKAKSHEKYWYQNRSSENTCFFVFLLWPIFKTLPSTSPMIYVFCLHPYAWLEIYKCHAGFGDIRVTHCQASAMGFIFTQLSLCISFRHGLIWTKVTLKLTDICWPIRNAACLIQPQAPD